MVKQPNHFETIAQSLMERQYGVIDHFLSPDMIRDLKNDLLESLGEGDFKKAGIGKEGEKRLRVRGDYIKWLEQTDANSPAFRFLQQIDQLIEYLNRTCFAGIHDKEFHYAYYPVGTFYRRHLDQFRKDDRRILSVICYLNEDWVENDGGELALYLKDGSTRLIYPLGGRVVCFFSDQLEHEVLPVQRPRLSITGWLKRGG